MSSTRIATLLHRASLIPRHPIAQRTLKPSYAVRPLTSSTKLYEEDKRSPRVAERALDSHDNHHGAFSRTDNRIQLNHPEDARLEEKSYEGTGGMHFKRTLSTFTLEGRTVVVTGGARGLGLVMSQACLLSGANVAIVDLNRTAHGVNDFIYAN